MPFALGACSLIDDDLTVCGDEMVIEYQVQLHTELEVQLDTELTLEAEEPVRAALEKWLEPIFTDKAKDIDLRFWLAETDEMRHRIQEIINDNHTSYTIRLPKEDYMHLAIANIADNRQVQVFAGDSSATMALCLPTDRDIEPLTTGLYTGRLLMEMNDTIRHFDVELYMVTSAVALIIDSAACPALQSMEGYIEGTANRFSVRDSIFGFEHARALWMDRLLIEEATPLTCLGTVGFPTRQMDDAWTITFTATLTDNRHTTSVLTIKDPLEAGELRIIKCYMDDNGQLNPDIEHDSEVGVTVTFDWNQGSGHDIDI